MKISELVQKALRSSRSPEKQRLKLRSLIEQMIGEDAEVRAEVIELAMEHACAFLIYRGRSHANEYAKYAAIGSKRGADIIGLAGADAARCILDRLTFGDKALGDMTGLDLDEMSEVESQLANGHRKNVALFRELRKVVGDNQKVRAKVSVAAADKIWERINGADHVHGAIQTPTVRPRQQPAAASVAATV